MRSVQNLQLEQLGRLIETTVKGGKGDRPLNVALQLMGSGQLDAVIPTQGKGIGQAASGFHQRLREG